MRSITNWTEHTKTKNIKNIKALLKEQNAKIPRLTKPRELIICHQKPKTVTITLFGCHVKQYAVQSHL